MGKKYSITPSGQIKAERDIYSLGGLLLKGTLGGSIKDETQLSQEGECWLNSGDISNRPDIVIKDNAFIGGFEPGSNPVHTDGITEFSGNTKIPGTISVRCFASDTKNNIFIKDSFIGVSMDVICGPATNAKAFPFEQGAYNKDVPKGTLFTSGTMKYDDPSICRNTATLRIGPDTYLYTPAGYNARVFWAYFDYAKNGLAYAGETLPISKDLTKLEHPVYNVCMVQFARQSGLTPTQLEESGAKIIGHVSGSVLTDLRPESASGEYVMDGSNFVMPTNNFAFSTIQVRFLAGELINTTMYTPTDRQDYKPYGRFRNVERLEYNKYLADSLRLNQFRDAFISAYDCPLLRIDNNTFDNTLIGEHRLILRNCVAPKVTFTHNKVLGDTYEDIDFSYAQEHAGKAVAGRTLRSSHTQGHYDMFSSGGELTGVISRPENIDNTARLTESHLRIPLDGDLIEQGGYNTGSAGSYEIYKTVDPNRVRMKTPLATRGAVFPALPSDYRMKAILYLDDNFVSKSAETDVTEIKDEYPYFVASFRKADDSAITVKEFVSKDLFMQSSDYTKYPIISGSGYVGAGVTVRGDVQVIGQKYEKRYFDINEWDRGGLDIVRGRTWDEMKDGRNSAIRMTTKRIYPISVGDKIAVSGNYKILLCNFDEGGRLIDDTGWRTGSVENTRDIVKYVGIALCSDPDLNYIDYSDIPLAEVRYITEFKKSRYITNELDRKDPSDTLLTPDYWEQGTLSGGSADAGKTYEDLKASSLSWVRLKRPINASAISNVPPFGAYQYYFRTLDAVTKFTPDVPTSNIKTALLGWIIGKSPTANTTPADVPSSRLLLEYVPTPRIVVPYGSATLIVNGVKIRMYDNAVLSRNLSQEGDIVLQGNAVMGYDFDSGACMCSNGHSDAIIKLP